MSDVSHWAYGHLTAAALLADTDADISTWPVKDASLLLDDDWPISDDEWAVTCDPASNREAVRTRGLDGVLRGQGRRNGALLIPSMTADKALYLRAEKFPGGIDTAPATIRYRDFNLGGYRVVTCLIDWPRELDGADYSDGAFRNETAFPYLNASDAETGV